MIETNMRMLTPSRKHLKPGDIFVLQMRDNEFIFGRVIRTDARVQTYGPDVLVYIYNAFSRDKNQIPVLDKNDLLIPPVITNKTGWLDGYFEVIAHRDLAEEDILQPHCFFSMHSQRYYDEYDHELPERVEPCGLYGLAGYRAIDNEVSDALGIPPVPFDPKTAVLWRRPRKK